MNWDWEKLQERHQGRPKPSFSSSSGDGGEGGKDIGDFIKRFRDAKFPGLKVVIIVAVLLWIGSGIYIVEPDEMGVVKRFGAYDRITGAGPHYHLPYPFETVIIPKVTQVRRVEIGFRTIDQTSGQNKYKAVPEESLTLTGDENIVDVQFIVQYQLKDPVHYLFNISDPDGTVKDAAEASMREVLGDTDIDSALTTGKLAIQNDTKKLMQTILDRYTSGIQIVAVQLQDVHPPKEVVEAFKDVASAREDKSRLINEAEGYRNDLIPKARGQAAAMLNEAEAYKESITRRAKGETAGFLSVLKEYDQAKDITRERIYIETMQEIMTNPEMEKLFFTEHALDKTVPYLPLERIMPGKAGKKGKAAETPDAGKQPAKPEVKGK